MFKNCYVIDGFLPQFQSDQQKLHGTLILSCAFLFTNFVWRHSRMTLILSFAILLCFFLTIITFWWDSTWWWIGLAWWTIWSGTTWLIKNGWRNSRGSQLLKLSSTWLNICRTKFSNGKYCTLNTSCKLFEIWMCPHI